MHYKVYELSKLELMKKEFDFNNIGKREPYTVPENFFTELEYKIESVTVKKTVPRILSWRYILSAITSVAAIAAIVLTIGLHNVSNRYDLDDVEQRFTHLSESDQNYLLEIYQEDILLTP